MNKEALSFLARQIKLRSIRLKNLYFELEEINRAIRSRYFEMKVVEASWEEDLTYEKDIEKLKSEASICKYKVHKLEAAQKEDKEDFKNIMRGYKFKINF